MRHVASALAHLPTLHCLDLACIGITAQVWEHVQGCHMEVGVATMFHWL